MSLLWGKFELDGLVLTEGHKYLKSHPLVVTHDNYVRADMKVELSTDRTAADVKVNLTEAARIDVTVVDSGDEPMEGYWILRLEDLNGRWFIPPGQDPHMSTFSSSVWTKNPDLRARENMSRVYHVEDDRLGRIQREAMFCTMSLRARASRLRIWRRAAMRYCRWPT